VTSSLTDGAEVLDRRAWLGAAALLAAGLSGCAGAGPQWHYRPVPGRTATLRGLHAVPPRGLPPRVAGAIQAGNRIAGMPYRYGGGHASFSDTAYDCSGAVSYVLRGAGLISSPGTSASLRKYGRPGRGKHITLYVGPGHCFIEVAGLRFDTGWHGQGKGPRWTTRSRPIRRYITRHPPGF
jgi:hypothetical protein